MTELKSINIALNVDAKGVSDGMRAAADEVKKGTDKLKSATDDVAKSTEAADRSVKTLQQSYRAAYSDAQRIADVHGLESQAFKEAAEEAGKYKNKLDDVAQVTKALASNAPVFRASIDVVKGFASGISAAAGAIGTFSDNKDLEVWAHRAQSAMALVIGLEGLAGLKGALNAFGIVIQAKVLPALRSLWVAIAANPITAIISALAAAAAAWGVYTMSTEEAAKAEIETKNASENLNKTIEEQTADLKKHNAELGLQLEAKKKGLSVDGLRAEQIEKELKQKEALLNSLKGENDAAINKLRTGQRVNSDIITRYTLLQGEISTLKAYQEELKKSADLQTKLSDKKAAKENIKTNKIKFQTIQDGLGIGDIQSISSKFNEAFDAMPKKIDMVADKYSQMNIKIKSASQQLKDALQSLAINGFESFAAQVGRSLAGANEDFAASAGQFIASIAETIGQGMIAIGIPMLATIATAAEGAAMIAAGGAVIAAGAAFGQASSGTPSGGASSSGNAHGLNSSYASSPSITPSTNNMYLSGILVGNDILISTKKTQQQYNRIK
jgi:hypothetical protein